jgi:hypothetical protein
MSRPEFSAGLVVIGVADAIRVFRQVCVISGIFATGDVDDVLSGRGFPERW